MIYRGTNYECGTYVEIEQGVGISLRLATVQAIQKLTRCLGGLFGVRDTPYSMASASFHVHILPGSCQYHEHTWRNLEIVGQRPWR